MNNKAQGFLSARMFKERAAYFFTKQFYPIALPKSVAKLWTGSFPMLVCWVFFIGCFPALCVDFELIGRSTFENYKPDGTKYKTFTGGFSVQKNGKKWAIVYSPDGVATTEHVMFDGEDVYTLTRNIVVDKNVIHRSSVPEDDLVYSNGIAYAKSSTAIIFSGRYPRGATSTPRLLWLALLSGDTLHEIEMPIIPAPWGASFMPESRSFGLNIDWLESTSEFPKKISFIASGELWTNSIREKEFAQVVPNASPFEDKSVAGIYQVMEWTNSDNGNGKALLPLTFEVERFYPPSYKTKATTAERYRCQVTTIKTMKPSIDLIQLNGDVNVLDYRFMDRTLPWFYVVYPITNKTWKTTNDPVVRESIKPYKDNFIQAHSMRPLLVKPPRPRTYVLVCMVLALLSTPVIVVIVWIRKIRNKTR